MQSFLTQTLYDNAYWTKNRKIVQLIMRACKDTEMFMNIFFKKAVIFSFKTKILNLKER